MKRKANKQKTKQALATLVMGLNLVNTMTPMAMAMQSLPEEAAVLPMQQSEAQPLDYAVLPHTVEFVDSIVFSKAEAANYVIGTGQTSTVDTMVSGDRMNISTGGIGSVTNMNGGTQTVSGIANVQNLNGGTQVIQLGSANVTNLNGSIFSDSSWYGSSCGSVVVSAFGKANIVSINGGNLSVYGSTATATVGTLNGVSTVNPSAGYVGTAGSVGVGSGGSVYINTMNGGYVNVSGDGQSTIETINGGNVHLYSGAILNNTVINGGTVCAAVGAKQENVNLNNNAKYHFDDNFIYDDKLKYEIGSLNVNGGIVDLVDCGTQRKFGTLTIDSLKGGGATFIMDTDLRSETDGDKIIIKNAAAGTNYIEVHDWSLGADWAHSSTYDVEGHKNLLLVTVENGSANFIGQNINNGGLWKGTPKIENGTKVTDDNGNVIGHENEWYLTQIEKSVNNDTEVLLESGDNSYALWRNTNDTLRKHLGDLRYRENTIDGDGVWAGRVTQAASLAVTASVATTICTS